MVSKRKNSSHADKSKKQKIKHSPEEFKQFYSSTLGLVNSLKDEKTNELLVTPFVKLPSKKLYPDYYSVIKNPITVGDIQKNLNKGGYSLEDTSNFLQDFKLLHENAIQYNDPESWIAQDSKRIYEFVRDQVEQFMREDEHNGESITSKQGTVNNENSKRLTAKTDDNENSSQVFSLNEISSRCKVVINEVIEHEFPEIGVISGPFFEDIDKKEYPDYYQVIQNPMSFKRLLSLLNKKSFFLPENSLEENLQAFYDNTSLIFSNAQLYNDPKSLIHQDAITLSKFFDEKYGEIYSILVGSQKREPSKLKLKLKNGKKENPNPPKVKLSLKLKQSEDEDEREEEKEPQPVVKKKRGRKRKDEIDLIKKEESTAPREEVQMGPNDQDRIHGDFLQKKDEADQDNKDISTTTESNAMGKTSALFSSEDAFIQETIISSPRIQVGNLVQQAKKGQLENTSKMSQLLKKALFPAHLVGQNLTLYEYKFPSTGYSTQSYCLSLPPDPYSLANLRILLHHELCETKKKDQIDGNPFGSLVSEEEFQYKLFMNEEEVSSSSEIEESVSEGRSLLSILYDLKLSLGINLITFECRVAPKLSQKIKKEPIPTENFETLGRHTRHQLNQLKTTWQVEKYNFVVVSNSA